MTGGLRFGNPLALHALWLAAGLALLAWRARARSARAMREMGDPAVVLRLVSPAAIAWRRRRDAVAVAAFAMLALAAARPQYGRVEQPMRRAGVDVLVAVDVSPSMLAQDVKPNRLAKAKESLKVLVRALAGDRVGIVAFAGEAILACPLTGDVELADLALGAIDRDSVGVAGTDLGAAIDVAARAFERGGVGSPVLVLLTDGEDNEGKGLAAAQEAAKKGLRIFAIGIGTDIGAPIPDGMKGYLETSQGTKVGTRLDMSGLGAIARATGGEAFHAAGSPAAAVDAVMRRIDRVEKSEIEGSRIVVHQDRFPWFLVPAMAMIAWLMVSAPRVDAGAGAPVRGGAESGRGTRGRRAAKSGTRSES